MIIQRTLKSGIKIGVTIPKGVLKMHKGFKWYRWHWKPVVSLHRKSVGEFRYKELAEDRNEIYDVQFGLMTHFIQVFFLCFIFFLDIPHETKGYGKQEYKRHQRAYATKKGDMVIM